jgi:hypothetical protein
LISREGNAGISMSRSRILTYVAIVAVVALSGLMVWSNQREAKQGAPTSNLDEALDQVENADMQVTLVSSQMWTNELADSDPETTVSFRLAFTNTTEEELIVASAHVFAVPAGGAIEPDDPVLAGKDMGQVGLAPSQTDTRAISGTFVADGEAVVVQVDYYHANDNRTEVLHLELPRQLTIASPSPMSVGA